MRLADRCSFCGVELMLGGVKYHVNLRITSAFDGYLPETNEDSDEARRRQIEDLIRSLDAITAEDAEAEVYQNMDLVLCPPCRKRLVKMISDLTGRSLPQKPKQETLLQ